MEITQEDFDKYRNYTKDYALKVLEAVRDLNVDLVILKQIY